MSSPVTSPCVNVCRMDDATGWCSGCLRTLDEIAGWSSLGDEARRAVWARLSQRRVQWRRLHPQQAALPPEPAAP
jgi:uncharacterized protein